MPMSGSRLLPADKTLLRQPMIDIQINDEFIRMKKLKLSGGSNSNQSSNRSTVEREPSAVKLTRQKLFKCFYCDKTPHRPQFSRVKEHYKHCLELKSLKESAETRGEPFIEHPPVAISNWELEETQKLGKLRGKRKNTSSSDISFDMHSSSGFESVDSLGSSTYNAGDDF